MKKLLFIIFLFLMSCGTTDSNSCPELVFIRTISYQGFVGYEFEGRTYFTSEERLELDPGTTYNVCTKDGQIVSISKQ